MNARTPELNLMNRMAHIARMEELVSELTEEGSQGRADLTAHVENLRTEIHAVYRAEKAEQIAQAKLYCQPAGRAPLPEEGPVYQAGPLSDIHVVSDGSADVRPMVERLPRPAPEAFEVHPGLLARAWGAVKGWFHA